jgi:uncharacterized protein
VQSSKISFRDRTIWLYRWGRWPVLTYLLACMGLYLYQERLIYKPEPSILTTPADRDLDYRDVWIPVDKTGKTNDKLFGWWLPATGETSLPQARSKGTILYLHGYNQNIGKNIDPARTLNRLGYDVLLVDYRGYGKSIGKFPSERQLYADAEIAWNYLVKTRKIPPDRIVIYGYSLGGAIAIDLATRHPEAASIIVQSSFTSMSAMVATSPWSNLLPMRLLLTQKFDSIAKVKSLKLPVLYIHGTADRHIPFTMSRSLYEATTNPHKQLVMVANAGHWNYNNNFRTPANLEIVDRFMARSIANKIP